MFDLRNQRARTQEQRKSYHFIFHHLISFLNQREKTTLTQNAKHEQKYQQ